MSNEKLLRELREIINDLGQDLHPTPKYQRKILARIDAALAAQNAAPPVVITNELGTTKPVAGAAPTPEQKAREMLERITGEPANNFTAGEVVELANLINELSYARHQQKSSDDFIQQLAAKLAEAEAEAIRLRDDAARYRWISNNYDAFNIIQLDHNGVEIEAAIDAARKK